MGGWIVGSTRGDGEMGGEDVAWRCILACDGDWELTNPGDYIDTVKRSAAVSEATTRVVIKFSQMFYIAKLGDEQQLTESIRTLITLWVTSKTYHRSSCVSMVLKSVK